MISFVQHAFDQEVTPYGINERRILDGTPTVAMNRFWSSPDSAVVHGVWEMTEGTIDGFDRDETFVVVSGEATIEFTERNESAELVAGSICVLRSGDPARITVKSTLRKVYALHGAT